MKMEDLKKLLLDLANSLDSDSDENVVMNVALDAGPEVFKKVAGGLIKAAEELRKVVAELDGSAESKDEMEISPESFEELAATAAAYDYASTFSKDGEWFAKEAAEIDELLYSYASLQEQKNSIKDKYVKKIDELRKRTHENPYDVLKAQKDLFDADDMAKRVNEQVKDYRIMEHPLSNRYCPDHTGVPVKRLEDGIVQCTLDNKTYNYNEGFTTMKGEKVPGGDVAQNTKTMLENTNYQPNYSTREEKNS